MTASRAGRASLALAALITLVAVFAFAAITAQPVDAQRKERTPPTTTSVTIQGIAGAFTLAGEFNQTIEVIEYQDGDDMFLRKRPGRTQVADFKITATGEVPAAVMAWLKDTMEGKTVRHAVTITQGSRSYVAQNCFPCALEVDAKGTWILTLATERCVMN